MPIPSDRARGPHEIDHLDTLVAWLDEGRDLSGVVLQGLDLTGLSALTPRDDTALHALSGTLLLGCALTPEQLKGAVAAGALVFPRLTGLPYAPHRTRLYTPEALYAGFDPAEPATYQTTPDARIWHHYRATGGPHPPSLAETLARRLHDHGVQDALEEFLGAPGVPQRVVGVMGGHSLRRTDPSYAEVVRLGRALHRRGALVVTGGGPGAMEAAHLGVRLAEHPDEALDAALQHLAEAPRYDHPRWLATAFEVLDTLSSRGTVPLSLGVPTWLYGHEPPTPFASHLAKLFANSVREEGLVTVARHGLVFAPGSAGTVQEVFQDACQNHYETQGPPSPMVFLGRAHWTEQLPVVPLLDALSRDRRYAAWILVTDDVDEALAFLDSYAQAPPAP